MYLISLVFIINYIYKIYKDKDNENIAQNNTKKSILVLISKIKRALLKNNTLLSTI